MNKYAKTEQNWFVAMPNSNLPTNFELNIFIFGVRASLKLYFIHWREMLESRPREGIFKAKFQTFFYEQIRKNSKKDIRSYARQLVTYKFSAHYLHFSNQGKLSNFIYFRHWSNKTENRPR